MTTNIAAELREIAKRMRPNRYNNYESNELLRLADALEAQQAEHRLTIQRPDGTYGKKARAEMLPDDMVVFDGPESELELLRAGEKFYRAAYEAAQAKIDALTAAIDRLSAHVALCKSCRANAVQPTRPLAACPGCGAALSGEDHYCDEVHPEMEFHAVGDAAVYAYASRADEADALRRLCAEIYQVAGAHNASEAVLGNLSAAANGNPLPHETLLPYTVAAPPTDLTEWQRELMQLADGMAAYAPVEPARSKECRAALESHAAQMVQRVEYAERSLLALAERTEYRGNSVSYIYDKKDAYGKAIDMVFDALLAKGHATKAGHVADCVSAALAALQSRCEAAEKDAARYRHLCEFRAWDATIESSIDCGPKSAIDAAIDAAIAAAKEQR